MKTILDLCGGTGSWSAPYREAGYDVRVFDLPADVRLLRLNDLPRPHGILAAPPCEHFAISGARWWAAKGPGALLEGLSVVDACLRLVLLLAPTWWALENPVGRLSRYIGPPRLWFHPCDYGDPWTKKTGLWGQFALPARSPVYPVEGSKMHRMSSTAKRERARTPAGFARAFYHANP